MTSKREREYAQRRQEKFEQRVASKASGRRRARRVNAIVAGAAVLAVVGVVAAVSVLGDDAGADDAVGSAATSSGAPAESVASAAEPSDAAVDSTCPPGPEPVADPLQLDAAPAPTDGMWTVTLATTCGDLSLELDGDAAPQAVGSFVSLAEQGYFDASPCHRLTTEGIFVLQCGDPTATGSGGPGYEFGPVENAPEDGVYPAGTVAMARLGGDGESMGSQFFLVYEDSTIPADAAGGYTVMGQVTAGLDVVQRVADGGLAADGIAPARSTGIVSVTAEESS